MKKYFIIPILSLLLFNCCSFTYMFKAEQKLDIIKRIPNAKKEIIFEATKRKLKTDYDIVGTDIIYEDKEKGIIRTNSKSYPENAPSAGSFSYTMNIAIKDDTIMISYENISSDFIGQKKKLCLNPKWEIIFNHIISLREKLITLIINDIITNF